MIDNNAVTAAMSSVLQERYQQDAKWGEQNHTMEWMSILGEEFGELCKEFNDFYWGKAKGNFKNADANLRYEAVQVAAVALAIIECVDRNKGSSLVADKQYTKAEQASEGQVG